MAERRNTGHRQRLRERFLAGEAESRSDEVLLELLLSFSIARKDVRPLAKELIRVFGSLSQALSASPDELFRVKGLSQASIALLKAVDFVRSTSTALERKVSFPEGPDDTQRKLFKDLPHGPSPAQLMQDSTDKESRKQKKSKIPITPKTFRRKLQVSRSHLLEFNHFSRVINCLLQNQGARKIRRSLLIESTGLSDGHVASLISIGAVMGLIQPGSQVLTPIGQLIAENDIFFETQGTLEWCHYAGAGNYRNLVWFELFNHLLVEEPAMARKDWHRYFGSKLNGQYSAKTIKDQVPKEVRFILDAYLGRNFRKLRLLRQLPDGRIYRTRYTRFEPLVLCAMVYDFCARKKAHVFELSEMAITAGSPAVVFGLDETSLRGQIEVLHDRGWLRYETTHDLDQIRLKPRFSAIEFLAAHFEDRPPREDSKPSPGELFE